MAACPCTGWLKRRAPPFERILARICREAGARVRTNKLVRDLNVPRVSVNDQRRIEVIADGLPLYGGAQIAIDTTLVSVLTRGGQPRMHSDSQDGVAVEAARRKKETRTYADVAQSGRCRDVLVAHGKHAHTAT